MFTNAITRLPAPNFGEGITTMDLGRPDYALMLRQHAAYVECLRFLGLEVVVLDPLPEHPDAYFVEDAAVVIPEAAVITRPGAAGRRGEEEAIEPVLAGYRPILRIQAPGTLDGGDVLMAGPTSSARRRFFVGISKRTNREGAGQLGQILEGFGYRWAPVEVDSGLHLKSSVSWAGEDRLLIMPHLAGRDEFRDFAQIVQAPEDGYATNMLLINGTFVVQAGFPRTRQKLEALGSPVVELDMSEARKMDGGLSCMSLRF